MAIVKGIKEKVHSPIYDAVKVEPEKQLRDIEKSSTLKFFVDVQGKTKLETNLQSASLLPHYNTFEARAMRVVISDLPPDFPKEPTGENEESVEVTDEDDNRIDVNGNPETNPDGNANPSFDGNSVTQADYEFGLDRLVELLHEAEESDDGFAAVPADDEDVTLTSSLDGSDLSDDQVAAVADAGGTVWLSVDEIEGLIDDMEDQAPPREQIHSNNGAGSILSTVIYNTVTTFYVGEKVMIEMPTWFFPGGAGPFADNGRFSTHGEPNPVATFRFAEPIYIDKQQNFRVEIDVPDSKVLEEVQKIYGPFFIWVVLDGYMTRGVQ